MDKPEALRLAAALENEHDPWPRLPAAAELRRLHAENEGLWKEREEPHKTIEMYVSECNRLESERDALKAQRAALLEELKLAADFLHHSTEFRLGHPGFERVQARARAAIKAAEEGK